MRSKRCEYRIAVNTDAAALEHALAAIPDARSTDEASRFDLGEGDAQEWPEATAYVDAEGIWFVDHCGGQGRAILAQLIETLTAIFGRVEAGEQ
jgi:hypothetical protein